MPAFRYDQFCPVARAAEILGHRWNLLVLRELFLGPQRFADLRRRLPGVSSSVLAGRLRALESQGLLARASLPPPAASDVYELTEDGRAFGPVLREIARWGIRFLMRQGFREGDHVEPDWVLLAALCFASQHPTAARRVTIRARGGDGAPDAVFHVAGGATGTRVAVGPGETDAALEGSPLSLLGALSGAFDPTAPEAPDDLELSGDRAALRELSSLFQLLPDSMDPMPVVGLGLHAPPNP